MNKKQMFAIYDSKGKMFKTPFMTVNTADAVRGFTYQANDKRGDVGNFPEDFCLMHLGYYDDDKGTFENLTAPVNMGRASDFLKNDLKVVENG